MQKDKIQRFLFTHRAIQGCLIRLNESYQTITLQHHYPAVLAKLLGEALLSVSMIASGFKTSGQTTLQFQGEGRLSFLSARITGDNHIRGLIRANPELISPKNLQAALHRGQLILTHEKQKPGQNYQSIIPVEAPSIAKTLEEYFIRSEQLPTRFFLASTEGVVAGLLLQTMPASDPSTTASDFQHACVLADTLHDAELLTLDFDEILRRLYHEDDLEVFPAKSIHFGCNCTMEKMEGVVASLGLEEAKTIFSEKAFIEVSCEFCGHAYQFDEEDIERLFEDSQRVYH